MHRLPHRRPLSLPSEPLAGGSLGFFENLMGGEAPPADPLSAVVSDLGVAKLAEDALPDYLKGKDITGQIFDVIQGGGSGAKALQSLANTGISIASEAACGAIPGAAAVMPLCTAVGQFLGGEIASFLGFGGSPPNPGDIFDQNPAAVQGYLKEMLRQLNKRKMALLVELMPLAGGNEESKGEINALVDSFYEVRFHGFRPSPPVYEVDLNAAAQQQWFYDQAVAEQKRHDLGWGDPDFPAGPIPPPWSDPNACTVDVPNPRAHPDLYPAAYGYALPLYSLGGWLCLGPDADPSVWWRDRFRTFAYLYKMAGIDVSSSVDLLIQHADEWYPKQNAYTHPHERQLVEAAIDCQEYLFKQIDTIFKLRLNHLMFGIVLRNKVRFAEKLSDLTNYLVEKTGTSPKDAAGVARMRDAAVKFTDQAAGNPPSKITPLIDAFVAENKAAFIPIGGWATVIDLKPIHVFSPPPGAAGSEKSHPVLKGVAVLTVACALAAGGLAAYRVHKKKPWKPANWKKPLA